MNDIDYSQLTPIILHGGAIREGVRFLGIIVPDTDGLLAIDERYQGSSNEFEDEPAMWAVTHIPTMRRMQRAGLNAETEAEAFALARRMYACCKKIGMDLAASEWEVVMAPYRALNEAGTEAFWSEIKGLAPSDGGVAGSEA